MKFFFRKINLKSIILPFIFIIIFIPLLSLSVLYAYKIEQSPLYVKIQIIAFLIAMLCDYIYLVTLIDLILKKRFIYNVKNITLLVLFYIIPTILLIMFPKYLGLPNIIILLIYTFVFQKYGQEYNLRNSLDLISSLKFILLILI